MQEIYKNEIYLLMYKIFFKGNNYGFKHNYELYININLNLLIN